MAKDSTPVSQREVEVLILPPLPADRMLVTTTDTLLSDVHFPPATKVEDLAHKALAVNLSDLAAMGACALAVQVQVHAPPSRKAWREALCDAVSARAGVLELPHQVNRLPLLATGLSVLALGSVKTGLALIRGGARPGDDIWVSGTLGDAGAGLALLMEQAPRNDTAASPGQRELCTRLQRPEPRLALGQALAGIAHSAIDISDGLAGDLSHILKRSGVAAELWLSALPLSPALRAWAGEGRARELALCAGDDYELCFTAPPAAREAVLEAARDSRTPVREVGRIEEGRGLRVVDESGTPVRMPQAYQHFRDRAS